MRCLTTNIWTPESGIRDSLGSWLLSFFRMSSTSVRHRLYLLLIVGLPLILLILSGFSRIFTEITWLYWLVSILSIGSFCFVLLPFSIFCAVKARKSLYERLLHSDFLFVVFLSVVLIRKFTYVQTNASFFIFFESTILVWLLLRIWESYRWHKLFLHHFKRPEFYWNDPFHTSRAWRWAILLSGSIILLNVSLFYSFGFAPSAYRIEKLTLAFLILSLPLTQWITNRFLAEADHYNFRSQNWKNFLDLRKLKSIIFHQHGVLTETVQKIEEIWIDEPEDFEKAEIEEALSLLCESGKHPICKLVVEKMKKTPKLLRILESEERPHLGILADLEGLDRERIKACLGTLSWQKILKHEVSEAGMQTIRSWRSKRYSFSLLSLNRTVVGAIAWETDLKKNAAAELRTLRQDGYETTVISSQIYPTAELETPILKDSSFDLLPIERPVHLENWLEREPNAIVVRSFWDSEDHNKIASIVIAKNSSVIGEYPLSFSNFNVHSISWLLLASRNYYKGLLGITGLTLSTALFVVSIPGLFMPIAVFFLFLASSMVALSRPLKTAGDS